MKIPRIIIIIPMTPHVSTFFSPRRPSLKRSVMISQKAIPNIIGDGCVGIIFDKDSPSPTR